jgi:hypothetical protein
MTAVLVLLILVGLLVLGLEYGRRRQPYPGKGFSGSSSADDRDLTRIRADLTAIAAHDRGAETTSTRYTHRHPGYPRPRAA